MENSLQDSNKSTIYIEDDNKIVIVTTIRKIKSSNGAVESVAQTMKYDKTTGMLPINTCTQDLEKDLEKHSIYY